MPANSFTIAPAAARGSNPSPVIAASFVHTAQFPVRRSRRMAGATPALTDVAAERELAEVFYALESS
jgi:hypothetical protein